MLVIATTACHRERHVYTTLTAVLRIADLVPPADRAGVVHCSDVALEGDARQVLAARASGLVRGRLETTGGLRGYRLEQIPPAMRLWGALAVDRPVMIDGKKVPWMPVVIDLAKDPLEMLLVAPRERPDPMAVFVAYAALNPEAFDVETRPFVVPEAAWLDFAIGVHAPALRAPVELEARITVRDGAEERDLWRAPLLGSDAGWRDERVDLHRLAGRTIRLRFSSRRLGQRDAHLLPVFAEPRVLVPRSTPAPMPNVVLISMDTLRGQSVSAYGAERPTTPTLDRLAREGVLFENAFSTAAYTLPGHMSMITGLRLSTHGVVTLATPLPPERRTLPELLRSAGYTTAFASSSSWWLASHLGFGRGIDVFSEYDSPFRPPTQGLPCEAFTSGLEWMRAHRDEPFYAFLHNYQVHRPYIAPPEYGTMFGTPPPRGPVEGDHRLYRYEQEVRYADDQLRAFLEGLDALGLSGRTLVIVTSDHGEAFGEHGYFEHTRDSHDETARVPLVMRLPGAIPAARRIAEPVSVADILPTVLDLLGHPPLPETDGMSLLPLMSGAADRLPRDGVFTESGTEGTLGWFDVTAIRSRTHSCIHNARMGTTDCFDRRRDPWERFDALPADDTSGEARSTRAALERFVAAHPPIVPRWTQDDVAEPQEQIGVDPERLEKLRELGYVE